MRKADREVTDPAELEAILRGANVVHLGLYDGQQVYVVPMNYGYAEGALFLHCAQEGRKLDILRASPEVCFTVTQAQTVVPGPKACGWSTSFCSIIGYGTARFLEGEEKVAGLDHLMAAFTSGPQEYDEKALALTCVLRIDIREMTGKRR